MTRRAILTCLVLAIVVSTSRSAHAQARLLVLCEGNACTFNPVASVLVGGRQNVRVLAGAPEKVGVTQIKASTSQKLEKLVGLVRDPVTGTVRALAPDGTPGALVVPERVDGRQGASPAAMWDGITLESRGGSGAKSSTPIRLTSVAYFIAAADATSLAFRLHERLVSQIDSDPRRLALIAAGLQYSAKSTAAEQWRSAVITRIRASLQRFEQQEGDPTTLADDLRDAARLSDVYRASASDAEKATLDSVMASNAIFDRRSTIADAFRKAALWDEYLIKVRQLGLARWSIPDVVVRAREAVTQSTKTHQERARQFAADGHLDRAFDEARLAAETTCDAVVADEFYRTRVQFVDRNQIAAATEYGGAQRALLEQIVRELDALDPAKEQITLARIQQGERLDASFLPLQLKKAEFLDKLGRFGEALAVLRDRERNVRLDRRQLEEVLRLDGRITNNLVDAVQKSQAETRRHFEAQRYQEALDAAVAGLKADPVNGPLLYHSALAAAFLRQNAAALQFIRTYLTDTNIACVPENEPATLIRLSRQLLSRRPDVESRNTIPSWISGARYRAGEAFYDPISLAFVQPIDRITADGLVTVFTREDRSFLVRSITTQVLPKGPTGQRTIFEAEPKYDRKALSMLEIGPAGASAAQRPTHPLTYLNSPRIDPDLVRQFAGKQIARGWAGNPFFHPFIWTGFYLFDLTYDRLGRLATADPVQEDSASRADPLSEPLQFTWEGDSTRLLSIKGTRTGYLRELRYDGQGRLSEEKISFPKGTGGIEYQYEGDAALPRGAHASDNFFDKRDREVSFDAGLRAQ